MKFLPFLKLCYCTFAGESLRQSATNDALRAVFLPTNPFNSHLTNMKTNGIFERAVREDETPQGARCDMTQPARYRRPSLLKNAQGIMDKIGLSDIIIA